MSDMKFTKDHEWLRYEGDVAVVGITDFAQSELGDLVFVNLPEVGDEVVAGEAFADVESVKAVSDVMSPVSGTVAEINEDLLDDASLINEDAYAAWFIKVENVTGEEDLLDEDAYAAICEQEETVATYIPNTKDEQLAMLKEIGYKDFDDLFKHIPAAAKVKGELNLPSGKSELEVEKAVTGLADKNVVFRSIFRGAGAYNHYVPATVDAIANKEEFLTAYTPYQAEISQGILQSIFEYQTMVAELTGMDIANASMYDGASAAAEACNMFKDRKHSTIYVSDTVDWRVLEVIKTYSFGRETKVVVIPSKDGVTDKDALKKALEADAESACFMMQYPNFYGIVEDADELCKITHDADTKFIMYVQPLALGMLKTPGEIGADVAVGEGQPLGLGLEFGGPYLGLLATKNEYMRNIPGRLIGETVDSKGDRGFVLTLQAREQHIRREKASSNICSNEALCALRAGIYLSTIGPKGLEEVATLCSSKAHYMAEELGKVGMKLAFKGEFWNEFVTTCPDADKLLKALGSKGILGGLKICDGNILWACTEMNTKEDIDEVIAIAKEVF